MTDQHRIYLPGLNGLRAIAALSVVFAHVSLKGIGNFGLPSVDLPMAGYGVTLFFVISGFLITFLLIKEKQKTGTVCINKFYLRRILRIWPIYYLFLLTCILFFGVWLNDNTLFHSEIWWYLFFAANIPFVFHQGILVIVHYWSIGVEEQFYLFWPWLVKFSNKHLFRTAFILFIFFLGAKLAAFYFFGKESFIYQFFVVTRFHCMMLGAMGAVLYVGRSKIIQLLSHPYVQIVSWILFIGLGFDLFYIPRVLAQELLSMAALSMIVGQITGKNRFLNLENRWFDFVGKISYGIYVIHPLIIYILSAILVRLDVPVWPKYIIVYVLVFFCTITTAYISYTYFEKPFLRLKNRFAIVRSSNSMFSK